MTSQRPRILFGTLFLIGLAWPTLAQTWDQMRDITPKGYVAYRAPEPLRIDGKLDDAAWQAAPWTDSFIDIEGDHKPKPRYTTRAKLLWDDVYLYVGAYLEEPHVWGTLTEKNSIIFRDNDFEIFIDPNGDNHRYYEFEINALNTIWELTLAKPYKDGGPATHGTNIVGLKSAVYVDGTLNAPHDEDAGWSVEVAIPWAGLSDYSPTPVPPRHGERWRINFSRVEWQHEVLDNDYRKVPDTPEANWVWSPQGIIDMHRPERWGYVQFSKAPPGTDTFRTDLTLPARDLLMAVYHAQKAFHATHGRWAATLDALGMQADDLQNGAARITGMDAEPGGFTVAATIHLPDSSTQMLYTNQTSQIWKAD